jgi:hypothetical protein
LPSIGVVVLALGFLLGDVVLAGAGIVVGAIGIASVVLLGGIAVKFAKGLFQAASVSAPG